MSANFFISLFHDYLLPLLFYSKQCEPIIDNIYKKIITVFIPVYIHSRAKPKTAIVKMKNN